MFQNLEVEDRKYLYFLQWEKNWKFLKMRWKMTKDITPKKKKNIMKKSFVNTSIGKISEGEQVVHGMRWNGLRSAI